MAHRPIFLAAALAAVTFLPGTGAFAQSYHRHWGDGNGPGMERGNYDQPQQAQAARVSVRHKKYCAAEIVFAPQDGGA